MLCLALASANFGIAGDFLAAADLSHLKFFEDRGVVYKDGDRVRDALEILRDRGLTCARLRLFTSSAAQAQVDPYNRINNLDYTLPLALRVKKAGLKLLLDFHYSDTWADPAKQYKPAAWTNLTFAQLEQQLYEYNSNTISAFKVAGVMPDYVQTGNEITGGLLWPEGRVGGSYDSALQWDQLGRLLKAAIRGVKDAAGADCPKIMLHIDRGGDWAGTQWFFDNVQKQQVEFDLIGESYYPFWHGGLNSLRACLTNAANRFARPVVVVETAFPWTNSSAVVGLPATPEGQVRFVIELAKIVKSVPGDRGAGICWWGSEYQQVAGVSTAGFEYRSLFDGESRVLPVAAALGQLAAPVVLTPRVKDLQLNLQWPISGAGLSLMTASNLATPALWQPVSNAVESTGAGLEVSLPVIGPSGFFRLQTN